MSFPESERKMSRSFVWIVLAVLCGLLAILKLEGVWDIAWHWVTFPIWGFVVLVFTAVVADKIWLAVDPKERRRRELEETLRRYGRR